MKQYLDLLNNKMVVFGFFSIFLFCYFLVAQGSVFSYPELRCACTGLSMYIPFRG